MKTLADLPDVVTLAEFALFLGVSTDTLRARVREGGRTLPPELPQVSKTHRWAKSAIATWLDGSPRIRRTA